MNDKYKGISHIEILHEVYRKALSIVTKGNISSLIKELNDMEKNHIKTIIDNFERGRGVLTVLITSLIHRLHNPEHNTYDFVENYVENLKSENTIKYEHKLKWNEIVSKGLF